MEPKWWHRDPHTGDIVVDRVFDTREYPITTACFVRDWSVEGKWTAKSYSGYIIFGSILRVKTIVTNHPWRIE